MKMTRAVLFAGILSGSSAAAQQPCRDGIAVPDFGYDVIACPDCARPQLRGEQMVLVYRTQPFLHLIRADGPAAGKLLPGDLLTGVDGYAIESPEATAKLNTWSDAPVTLGISRGSLRLSVSVTPVPMCIPARSLPARPALFWSERFRTLQLYDARVVTLQQLENDMRELGALHSESATLERRILKELLEAGQLPARAYALAAGSPAVIDSLQTERTMALFLQRAITRRQFEEAMGGPLRADSILRSREGRSADQAVPDFRSGSAAAALHADWVAGERAASVPTVSLGIGLLCDSCTTTRRPDGRIVWQFRSPPRVGRVESASLAESLGIRQGDVLRKIDDLDITSTQGGERLSAPQPGNTVKLEWTRGAVSHTASIAIPELQRDAFAPDGRPLRTERVGNATVQISGAGSGTSITRNPATGELRIVSDSLVIIVKPPPGGR